MNLKKLFFFFLVTMVSLSAAAEESYYYCGSSKIKLIKESNKAIVMTPKRLTGTLRSVPSISIVRSLTADLVDMTVIQKKGTFNISDLKNSISDSSAEIIVYPSYSDEQGKSVFPTGYIYVELKSESDYQILQQQASKYGCRIVGQNIFMPLWYTLQVTAKSVGDCVDIANKIYESGFFSNASPSFAFDLYISYDPES